MALVAHTLATEGAVAEQVETVWTGLRERHVGQICGKGKGDLPTRAWMRGEELLIISLSGRIAAFIFHLSFCIPLLSDAILCSSVEEVSRKPRK